MSDGTVITQIRKLKSLGICNMMDLEKVRYFAEALKLDELVKMIDRQQTSYRILILDI